ncbi:MAG: molybdenum cofactor guanylyltransferase MobA [Pseudomonadota bacterium]
MKIERDDVVAVLLAGGLARRMGGGDKCLRDVGGRSILNHVLDRISSQVSRCVLNANGDASRFDDFGLPVVADVVEGFAGPLAGVLTGLEWVRANAPQCRWIVSVPTDGPFVPRDLVPSLAQAVEREGADLACAKSGDRTHPVAGLWPVSLTDDLRRALVDEEIRKVDVWTARHRLVEVTFPFIETGVGPVDPFFNANRPEDLEEAQKYLAAGA